MLLGALTEGRRPRLEQGAREQSQLQVALRGWLFVPPSLGLCFRFSWRSASRQNRQDEQPRGERSTRSSSPGVFPPHPSPGKGQLPCGPSAQHTGPICPPFHAHVACARPQAELTSHRFTSRGPGKCLYFGMSQKYIFVQSGEEQSVFFFFLWKGWGHGEEAWAGLGGGPGVQEQ